MAMWTLRLAVLAAGLVGAQAALAQAPAGAPAGANGMCKDGSYSTSAKKEGACRGHKGVQTWFMASAAAPAASGMMKPSKSAPMQAPMQASGGPAPAGANGICKDGSYSMSAKKEGACRGHKGVQTWYAAAAAASTPAMPMPAKPSAMPAPTPMTSAPSRPMPTPAASAPTAMPAPATASGKRMGPDAMAAAKPMAPGGGPGMVWVNTESNVYHCNGDVFYGKTKKGAYMSEADAKAKGARGERGKVCTGK